jgi:alkylhydroperoxidase AhpD family core domain
MQLNETLTNMFADLGIDASHTNQGLQILSATDSKFLRDLKLNVSGVLNSKNLTKKEAALLALSTAVNEKNHPLIAAFTNMALKEGAAEAEVSETHACTALMNTNNVFYRFRHYMHDVEYYNNQPAGLRAGIMMNPVLGKEFFEVMSLAVSTLNNCERCITSHESTVKQHGTTEARIYDAVRLVSVIKSLCIVI